MVDDLEERLSRYRADLDAAVAADLARRHLANREAGFHDEEPLLLDTEPEQLVPVKQIYASVDSPPTSEVRNRRRLAMAAAAVAAVMGVAAIAINSMNSDDGVEPAPAAATTVAPTTVAPRREAGAFEGGKRVTYTVPDGWENIGVGGESVSQKAAATGTECRPHCMGVVKGDPAISVVFVAAQCCLYTHYCGSALGGQVGGTIDDLVSAWTSLPGVDATAARDVTVDGFDAKEIELTVSAETMNAKDCSGMFYRCSFGDPQEGPSQCKNELEGRTNQELKIWILDIYGERHMIVAGSYPDTSQQDRAALDEIVASIQIG